MGTQAVSCVLSHVFLMIEWIFFVIVTFNLLLVMEKQVGTDSDLGREGSKKPAAVSRDGERPSKTAGTRASSDTHRLEDISVPCRQGSEDEEVEEKHLVKARDVRDKATLPLW